MFDASFIQKLKQVNVSAGAEKTKARASQLWKSAKKADRDAILALAGVTKASVQRAYKTGNISAKLVIPFAQTFNVDPNYIIGEADKAGKFSDDAMMGLLKKWGYGPRLADAPAAVKKPRKPRGPNKTKPKAAPAPTVTDAGVDVSGVVLADAVRAFVELINAVSVSPDEKVMVDSLTDEDMIILMKAVTLRSKAGGMYAKSEAALKLLLLGLS